MPPGDSIISFASSRVRTGRAPVSTKVLPASGSAPPTALPGASAQATPTPRRRSTTSRLCGWSKNVDALRDDRADVGDFQQLLEPPPSAGRACRSAWPGPSPSSRRRGGCRARTGSAPASSACCLEAPSRLAALFSPLRSRPRAAPGSSVEVGQGAHQPESTSWSTSRSPRPSMSSARRPAKCRIACLRCAGQNRPPEQRQSTPPFSRITRCRRPGTRAAYGSRALRPARSRATPTTSGITSPARRTITVSPIRTPLRRISTVVQGRIADRRAADEHRLELGHRRQLAGAADLHVDAFEHRRLLLRRVLVRHGPARLARLEAESLLQRAVVDLVDDAVDVEGSRRAARRSRHESRPGRRRPPLTRLLAARPAGPSSPARRAGRAAWPAAPALQLAQTVGEEAQRPLGGDAGVELAHHTGGGIARVDEGLLALRSVRSARAGARSAPRNRRAA